MFAKIDDYREYAKNNYLVQYSTEQIFESDLQTMTRINTSIKRLKSGNDNVRLVMNQLITWFNIFEREAAINLLMAKVDEANKSSLVTIMAIMDYIPVNMSTKFSKIKPDARIAGLVYSEIMGNSNGQIYLCSEAKHCA